MIAPEYTYEEFIFDLGKSGHEDLQLVLLEINDKTSDLNVAIDTQLDEIFKCAFYFPDEAYVGCVDILAYAWFLNIPLLSIQTTERWKMQTIEFAKYDLSQSFNEIYSVHNISCKSHGILLKQYYLDLLRPTLESSFPGCRFTDNFKSWIEELSTENKTRVFEKLMLAASRQFEGGEPLFKTLDEGIREIRFSASSGGAIRILFSRLGGNSWGILNAFIKKADAEGYDWAIPQAKELLKKFH